MSKRILVMGEVVRSKTDGQLHYVGPDRLCLLYGVNPHECILVENWPALSRQGLDPEDYEVLTPRYDGDYRRERRE